MQESFKKEERLKKKKLIAQLFNDGKSLKAFPLKLIYLKMEHDSAYKILTGVSVPKKNFKKAVDRNKIKRLLRELYRQNKYLIYNSEHTKKHLFMFIYLGKKEFEYKILEEKMMALIRQFLQLEET